MPHKDHKARLAYIRAHHDRHRTPKPVEQNAPDLPPLGVIRHSDDGNKIQCHACGQWFSALNSHLKMHGLDAESYKERYGLARGASLTSLVWQERQRQAALDRDQGSVGRANLPPPQGRAPGIEVRLGDRLARSASRKGKYVRGKRPAEG